MEDLLVRLELYQSNKKKYFFQNYIYINWKKKYVCTYILDWSIFLSAQSPNSGSDLSGGKKPTQHQINAAKVARQLVQTNSQGQIIQQQIRPRLVTTTAQPRPQLIKPQHSQADLIKYYQFLVTNSPPLSQQRVRILNNGLNLISQQY